MPDESFTTEKTAVQEKIIVGNKPVKKVIRRAPVRRVVKADPSRQQAKVKSKTEVPPLPAVPPVGKGTTPPPISTTAFKEATSRKIIAPPVPIVEKIQAPDTKAEQARAEAAKAEQARAEAAKAEQARAEAAKAEQARAEAAKAEQARAEAAKAEQARAEATKAEQARAEAAKAEQARAVNTKELLIEEDLKKIEGIGPKLSKVLHAAGVVNFKQLADKSVAEIQDILDDAGPRYRIARPKSWPLQAAMAAAGDWDKLKAFQDEMRGGILPD